MATNNSANIGTAASGKVLQGAGAGVAPTFSTPTYPSASGTARKMLVSDGTNNVYSTETWAVPGTNLNVLTSDGTNWISSAPAAGGGPTLVTLNITSAQIKALHGTPITVVSAPGAGKILQVIAPIYVKFNYGGTNVFTAAASQAIKLYYGTATAISGTAEVTNAQLTGTTTFYKSTYTGSATITSGTVTTANIENLALTLYNDVATEITGNAANNNTMTVSFCYITATLT